MTNAPLPSNQESLLSSQELEKLQQAAKFVCKNLSSYQPKTLDFFWEIKKALANGLDYESLSSGKGEGITNEKCFNFVEKELKCQAKKLRDKSMRGRGLTADEQMFLEKSFDFGLINFTKTSSLDQRKRRVLPKRKIIVDEENTANGFGSIFLNAVSDPDAYLATNFPNYAR